MIIERQLCLPSAFGVSGQDYKNRNCVVYFAALCSQGHDVLTTFIFEDFSRALIGFDSLVTVNDSL